MMVTNAQKVSNDTKIWIKTMKIGAAIGCHQRADRSFFWNGHQFPICARCTGVLIGYISALTAINFFLPNFLMGLIFCCIMFADWFIQYIKIKESTNVRRLITGILGGFGIIVCEFNIVLNIILIF